ncbi:MAG: histidinol-phosphate transaminase [gamma proteobacterium symbiont of Taylorina sp.]|nr:histidinol-phosphate transaminase [gamma proteobacterium symbiont of Taylorina sp.]
MSHLVKQWIREDIRSLSAYHVPNPGKMIKLDAMENPYCWPQSMQQEWLEFLADAPVNRYPDPAAEKLVQQIETVMAVPKGMKSILGNGSDELIQIICMALSQPGSVVMAPEPTFVMYQMIARFTNMNYQGIPLDKEFQLDMPAMLQAMEIHQPAVIFLAYPNNPTGNLFSAQDVRQIIDKAPGLVVVDEAYHAFADSSFMSLLSEYNNLLVMRTVSKMGLAGLRLGLLSGSPEWIDEFDKIRLPYNINVLTQLSAVFALQRYDVLEQQTQQICRDREKVKEQLNQIHGLVQYPSAANFILFKIESPQPINSPAVVLQTSSSANKTAGEFMLDKSMSSDMIFAGLKNEGILIKRFADTSGSLANCLRVTIGTAEENQAFINALKKQII